MNISSASAGILSPPALSISKKSKPLVTVCEKKERVAYSDDEILEGIKKRNEKLIKYIYKTYYHEIRFMVVKNSGSDHDAEDVFQDTMMLLYQKVTQSGLKLSCSFNTYLVSIAKHLWLQKLHKRTKDIELVKNQQAGHPDDELLPEDHLEEMEKFNLFHRYFQKLTKAEQQVLRLYMKKVPIKVIAELMGYKSDDYVKCRKYMIKEKLKNMIMNDKHFQQLY